MDELARTARDRWAEETLDHEDAMRMARSVPPAQSVVEALSGDQLAFIVEPKRATADRGVINESLDIAAVACEAESHGAHAMSIVAEPVLSRGSTDDVAAASGACGLPVIGRDVVVDVRQVLALRAAGADAVMFPVAIHLDGPGSAPDEEPAVSVPGGDGLGRIIETAHAVGMEVVLTVRREEDVLAAVETDADALNIDNRDDDGAVDVDRTLTLLADVPAGWPVISESIAATDEVARLQRAGVDALLLDEGHLDVGLETALEIYGGLALD